MESLLVLCLLKLGLCACFGESDLVPCLTAGWACVYVTIYIREETPETLISLLFLTLMNFYIFQLCSMAYLCPGSITENSSVIVNESLSKTKECACMCVVRKLGNKYKLSHEKLY